VPDDRLPVFEVYAARLGTVAREARDNFLNGRDRQGTMMLDFDMWIIRADDRVVVVDSGPNDRAKEQRGRELARTAGDAVRALGIEPESVADLVLTHLHYDHAGRIDEFPNARIWIQERELAYAMGPSMAHPSLNHFFDVDDLREILGRLFRSDVTSIDGTHELTPGIELHLIGGHTRGLQVVRVHTERGWVILASDALHYYENFELQDPFPAIVDLPEILHGYERIRVLADSPAHIVPGHDPMVMSRHPSAGLPPDVVALHRPPIV
jgi:glyoxylase-like metal-dependent hydrolase (beta-lactamase superfamily II)